MRVITFSRQFPTTHPRKGEPTQFVEKVWKSLYNNGECPEDLNTCIINYCNSAPQNLLAGYNDVHRKVHTIRAGNRWKVGDWFTPKVRGNDINPKSGRSGRPYQSKQIQFAPPIEIKKIWQFEKDSESQDFYLDGELLLTDGIEAIAKNDGLELANFYSWFNKPFSGQVICWNDKINY